MMILIQYEKQQRKSRLVDKQEIFSFTFSRSHFFSLCLLTSHLRSLNTEIVQNNIFFIEQEKRNGLFRSYISHVTSSDEQVKNNKHHK